MHFDFIPYGKRECVERLLRDMEAQKHQLFMTKGKEKAFIWIDSQVRAVPFGVYEYVCPKEDMAKVATTLNFDRNKNYIIKETYLKILRKLLRLKKCPEFKKDKKYLWRQDGVSVIPIGIREDGEIIGKEELDKGWLHEAI